MKLKFLSCNILILLHFTTIEANGESEAKVASDGENNQLANLIAPNDNDHNDAKRFHLSKENDLLRFPFSSFPGFTESLQGSSPPRLFPLNHFPGFTGQLHTNVPPQLDEPKKRPHSMTNAFKNNVDRDSTVVSINNHPPTSMKERMPKFVFSSLHNKLIPRDEDSTEQDITKSLLPDIIANKISPPELIPDAPDSSEMQHESNPSPVHIMRTTTITRTQGRPAFTKPISPIEVKVLSPQSPHENDFPFGHPFYKEFLHLKPSSDEQDQSNYKSIFDDEDNSTKSTNSNKPAFNIAVKSKLTITKIKTQDDKRPVESIMDSLDDNSDEIDFDEASRHAKEDRQPQCPTPSDFVEGSKNLWKGFRNGETWSDSFGAVAATAVNIADSVQLCARRVWNGITSTLGFGGSTRNTREATEGSTKKPANKPNSNSTTTAKPKEAKEKVKDVAEKIKKGFNEKVAEPVKKLFSKDNKTDTPSGRSVAAKNDTKDSESEGSEGESQTTTKPASNSATETPNSNAATTAKPSSNSTSEKPKGTGAKIKEAAEDMKKGFKEKVSKPAKKFFDDLGTKTKTAFGKRNADASSSGSDEK